MIAFIKKTTPILCLLLFACAPYTDLKTMYETDTSFSFPDNAKIIRPGILKRTKSNPFEKYIVFNCKKDYIKMLLSEKPPFSEEWNTGIIPDELGFYLEFGDDIQGMGHGKYIGTGKIVDLLNSENKVFSIKTDKYSTKGMCIIIDIENNTVWYSSFKIW